MSIPMNGLFMFQRSGRQLRFIQKLALFLSKTEGRDKTCKLLQYVFRFMAAYYLSSDSYRNTKYQALAEATKDARKIFRLFKSVNESQAMTYILFNQEENLTNLLKIVSRVCYFFYWGFDNVSILSKVKLFKFNFQKLYTIGYTFWFLALLAMNLTLLIELFWNNKRQKLPNRFASTDQLSGLPQNCTLQTQFKIVKRRKSIKQITFSQKQLMRRQKWLQLIKNSADLLPSGKDSGMINLIFNRTIPQSVVSIGGALSAAISIYQTILIINTPQALQKELEKKFQ